MSKYSLSIWINESEEEYDVFSGGIYTTPTTISSSKLKYVEAILNHKTNLHSIENENKIFRPRIFSLLYQHLCDLY